jgi:predicted ATPase
MLRIKGELFLFRCARSRGGGRVTFSGRSTGRAGKACLSWELRAATSLARLRRDQGRSADATALLQPVYDRFTEGFATADLTAAKALLDDL